jgi:2-polyprenyl-3-methyl-5-hydroxy-6-metoxy-1,4-benzoquinol methylase
VRHVSQLISQRTGWTLSSLLGVVFPKLVSSATWDREFAGGAWDHLRGDSEFGRYAVIAGHLLKVTSELSVLDVGCGQGRLLELVSRFSLASYVGLDVSHEAVARARALKVPSSSFAVCEAESFATDQRFDAIVFNEVAYYLKDPVAVLSRYHAMLRPGGMLIVSMYDCLPARLVWRGVKSKFDTVAATRIANEQKSAWDVRVIRAHA